MEPDSCGLATLTGSVEGGRCGSPGTGRASPSSGRTEQNGELFAGPIEAPTHDHPSPRISGNDHLMQLLGKTKMPVSERNLAISLIENSVVRCSSTMLVRHCFRRAMIGWRKSGRKVLGWPGT